MATLDVESEQVGLSRNLTDLTECNREKIHLVSAVQGRGCLLLFTANDLRVQCASENVNTVIESSYQDVIGAKLDHILDAEIVTKIRERVASFPWGNAKGRYFQHNDSLDCYLFETEKLFGLEIQKRAETRFETVQRAELIDERIRDFHSELKRMKDVEEVAHLACQAVRAVIGVERVMMYRFLYPSWHGEVIGEDRAAEVHSFLKHRFPSSDIPQPARDLYLRNSVRIISDISQPDSLVVPDRNPLTGKIVDLSDSRLRAVSKIHIEYLRNMGVQASLSFAVTVRGELWGLIACHSLKPFNISQEQRAACELISEAVAAMAPLLETLNSYRQKISFETRLKRTIEAFAATSDPTSQIFNGSQISEIFEASGVARVTKEKIDFTGITPRPIGLKELSERIQSEPRTALGSLVTENLHERFSGLQHVAAAVSGLMAYRNVNGELFMIFRPEVIKTITWGGDPVKQLERKGFQGQINPRHSFEAWQEVIRGRSKPWQPFEVEGLQLLGEIKK